jgi:DNA polymerase-3 subunit delta
MMMKSAAEILAVYAIVGADRFLRQAAVSDIVAAAAALGNAAGPTRFDGGLCELADVLDELRTFSLLGGRRLAVVDDADAFVSAHRAALERYCEHPATESTLVLACQTLPSNTRLYRIIHKVGSVTRCESLKGRALVEWAMRRADSWYRKRMSRAAAGAIVEHIGDSTGAVDSELAKLATFVGARPEITPEDVDSATGRAREENVFAVIDAMASGDVAGAIRHWEQVLATDRAAPGRAIAGLAWGVRRLLEARREFERGVSPAALARKMFTDPDVLLRRLQRTSVGRLVQQQSDLLAADLAVKTGASAVETAVEGFIVKHGMASPSALSA